jgi:hypothetical protein
MAIKEKLNSAWQTDQAMDSVFEFRAVIENLFNTLQETINRIDEIAGSANFADVDEEIKAEGVAIRKILNDAKASLDSHSEFITWRQLEE